MVLFMLENLGMSSMQVGGTLTAAVLAMVAAVPTATRVSDRMLNRGGSRKTLMVPALATTAALTALQPFAATPLQFAVVFGASSVGSAVSSPSVTPLILDACNQTERAKALAMRQTIQDVGTLFGASSMGYVATQLGIPVAIQTTAALQALAVLWFAFRVPGARPSKLGG